MTKEQAQKIFDFLKENVKEWDENALVVINEDGLDFAPDGPRFEFEKKIKTWKELEPMDWRKGGVI